VSTFDFAIENEAEFKRQLERLSELTNDFRIPLNLIALDFFQSQKKIFTLKSAGKYQDLSPEYKKRKTRLLGNPYPILVGPNRKGHKGGRLAASTLDRNHPDSEFYLGKQELILGTSTPYAIYHQSDAPRSRLPQRKVIFIDGGPIDEAKDGVYGRRDRWANIIFNYIQQLINREV
jgi:hypothetical protein